MENDFNFFNQYLDSQKNMMDMWNQMSKNFNFNNMNMSFNSNPFETYQKMMEGLTQNNLFEYTGSPAEVLTRLNQSSQVYYNLYKLYTDLYEKNIEPTEENLKKYLDQAKEQSLQYVNNYIFPYLPTDLQDIIKKSMGLGESYQAALKTIYGPWADSAKTLTDNFMMGAFKDPEGFLDYFETWKKNYSETFGKLLNIPQFGLDRNNIQERMQTFDKYIRFVAYYTELLVKLSTLVNETTENVVKETFEMIKSGTQPKTFEEFYNYWKTTLSNNFDKLFYSDEFSKFLGNFVDSLMVLKIDVDKVLEDSIRFLPVPTKTDMDSLYKTVYDLKKEVRALKRQLRESEFRERQKEKNK